MKIPTLLDILEKAGRNVGLICKNQHYAPTRLRKSTEFCEACGKVFNIFTTRS